MEIAFFGKIRDVGASLIVTVPSEIVEKYKFKAGQAYQFTVFIDAEKEEVS